MASWSAEQVAAITAPQEVQISTRRADGSLRMPTTIWIVGDGDRLFVRSTNGRPAAWFRGAIATGAGQIHSGGNTYDVVFFEAVAADLPSVDRAYRTKYRQYPSIVDHLLESGPRSATLEVFPA